MQIHGHLYAGTPILRKIQIGEALPLAGVPVVASVLVDVDGVLRASTTAAADSIGVTLDAQPIRNTAQQPNDADPAVYVTVNVRPDQIVKARLSGGATAATALAEFTNTVASTDGLLITAPFGVAYDDGYAWGATGLNATRLRKITAVNTTATPVVAFNSDIAIGATFYAATFGPFEKAGVQLTSNRAEVDATADNQAGTNFRCIGLTNFAKADGAALGSYAELVFTDHLLVQA